MTACIGLGKAWLSFWSGKYGIVWLKSLVMIVSHWKDGRLLLEYVADTPLGKFSGTVSRSLPLIPSSGVCTRSIVFSSLILRRALIEYLLLDKCEPWKQKCRVKRQLVYHVIIAGVQVIWPFVPPILPHIRDINNIIVIYVSAHIQKSSAHFWYLYIWLSFW